LTTSKLDFKESISLDQDVSNLVLEEKS